jgi:hypothetical protein
VVQASRPFIGRLYKQVHAWKAGADKIQNPFMRFSVSEEMKKDLRWWDSFIESWNGIHLMYDDQWDSQAVKVFTDACGSGYGAVVGDNWFQGEWTEDELREAKRAKSISMVYLEFKVLVLAASTFGHRWSTKSIEFKTDNESTVAVNKTQYSSDTHLLGLLRTLCYIAYQHNFRFRVTHIPGKENDIADRLSRFTFQPFESLP